MAICDLSRLPKTSFCVTAAQVARLSCCSPSSSILVALSRPSVSPPTTRSLVQPFWKRDRGRDRGKALSGTKGARAIVTRSCTPSPRIFSLSFSDFYRQLLIPAPQEWTTPSISLSLMRSTPHRPPTPTASRTQTSSISSPRATARTSTPTEMPVASLRTATRAKRRRKRRTR